MQKISRCTRALIVINNNVIQVNANNIEKQYFTSIHDDIRQLLSPLSHIGIVHFSHVRRWSDHSYSLFTSDPEFSVRFVKDKFYKKVFGAKADSYQPGVVFMDDLDDYLDFIIKASVEIGHYKPDLLITEVEESYTDFYWFGTPADKKHVHTFYINHIMMLKNYIQYFNTVAKRLLKNVYSHRLMNDEEGDDKTPLANKVMYDISCEYTENINQSCYDYVFRHAARHQFTPQELNCAVLLCDGLATKEIALKLDISPRTVEKHILSLRQKMNARNMLHLVTILFKALV